MMIIWEKCETCIHNDVCSKKKRYETLAQKIQNVDKAKPYSGFRVEIDCVEHRLMNNVKGDQFNIVVRA